MKFPQSLKKGTLIKRYKRFLADVVLEDGALVTAHTANTGSMKGCNTPGSTVWLSHSDNNKRKYPLSWELIEVAPNVIAGINTGLANRLVREAIERGVIVELEGGFTIQREVRYGKENSRIDLLLEADDHSKCYVEVKNVTLAENGIAFFPDAVSKRGTKHLRELAEMVRVGHRAVILYCIQRNDTRQLRPADKIDPQYGETLRSAISQGVEALAYSCSVSPVEIVIDKRQQVICP